LSFNKATSSFCSCLIIVAVAGAVIFEFEFELWLLEETTVDDGLIKEVEEPVSVGVGMSETIPSSFISIGTVVAGTCVGSVSVGEVHAMDIDVVGIVVVVVVVGIDADADADADVDVATSSSMPFNCETCNVFYAHRELLLPLPDFTHKRLVDINKPVAETIQYHRCVGHNSCCPRSKHFFDASNPTKIQRKFKDRSQQSGQPYFPTALELLWERRRYLLLHKSLNDDSILSASISQWKVVLPAITYMGVKLPALPDPGMHQGINDN